MFQDPEDKPAPQNEPIPEEDAGLTASAPEEQEPETPPIPSLDEVLPEDALPAGWEPRLEKRSSDASEAVPGETPSGQEAFTFGETFSVPPEEEGQEERIPSAEVEVSGEATAPEAAALEEERPEASEASTPYVPPPPPLGDTPVTPPEDWDTYGLPRPSRSADRERLPESSGAPGLKEGAVRVRPPSRPRPRGSTTEG